MWQACQFCLVTLFQAVPLRPCLTSSGICHRMLGAGRASGEPLEIAWADTGRLGITSQYAAAPMRQVILEYAFYRRNAAVQGGMAPHLLRMMKRARAELQAAAEQILRVFVDADNVEVSHQEMGLT